MLGDTTMRTLYVREDAAASMPSVCQVMSVSPLLRELIVRATELPLDYDEHGPAGHVVSLILAELREPAIAAAPAADAARRPAAQPCARPCWRRRATSSRWRRGPGRSTPAPAPSPAISRPRPD